MISSPAAALVVVLLLLHVFLAPVIVYGLCVAVQGASVIASRPPVHAAVAWVLHGTQRGVWFS